MVHGRQDKLISAGLLAILIGFAFLSLFPVLSLLVASLSPASDLMRYGLAPELFFSSFDLENYRVIFGPEGSRYWTWYLNSIIVSSMLIALSLFFSSMVGYALAMYEFPGKRFIFIMVLLVLMIPFEIMMLPLFQLVITLGLIDTYFGTILPLIVAPVAVFFFRQYSLGLPKEVMEAARVDGCTEYGIFFRIMVPLMLPSFAAMAIFQGLISWNNFLWPLLVLRSNDMLTLPIGLATLLTPYGTNYQLLFAGAMLSIVPIVILFLVFQRYFIAGLMSGSVKG
ncbi:carbohydrate ABC transporter permease [Natronospirillum operosum]|uniref:Carbohydrate ABC transporter permease n=1 Tax=Natronospirillum operosum TaxID=2759953 RepID=A0A4Z0WG64_9GAMM|nr:carbohydrate ABC transporter permease [Natronospirillum operosum]TGG93480.1 carbohydrate ABC transporter permease [Natronospirillum operosum]